MEKLKRAGRVVVSGFWVGVLLCVAVVAMLLMLASKCLGVLAETLAEASQPIVARIDTYLETSRALAKLTFVQVSDFIELADFDAQWRTEALDALARGETVKIAGIEQLLVDKEVDEQAAVAAARARREAWEKMSPAERYMQTHPADKGGPKTLDEAIERMKAEAGRPFDFNDPAVQAQSPASGDPKDGAGRLQQSAALVDKNPDARPEVATHGYTPDEPHSFSDLNGAINAVNRGEAKIHN